jgi:hypothetical protein
MMRRLRSHPLTFLAALFFLAAAVFAGLWIWSGVAWLIQLAPNVITEGVGVGLALTVIDAAIRRRDRSLVQPLVDYVLDTVRLGVSVFAMGMAHSSNAPADSPQDVHGFLTYWLQADRGADADTSYALRHATDFALESLRYADENRHDLPVELAVASRKTATSIALASTMANTVPDSHPMHDDYVRLGASYAITAMAGFVDVLERVAPAPTGPVQIPIHPAAMREETS